MPEAMPQSAAHPRDTARRAGDLTDRQQRNLAEHALASTLNRAPAVATQLQLAATLNSAPRIIAQRQLASSLGGAVVQMGGKTSKLDDAKKPAASKPAARPPVEMLDDETPIPATFDLTAPPSGAAAAAAAPAAAGPARTPLYPERRFTNMSPAQVDKLREADDYRSHQAVSYFLTELDRVDESKGTAVEGDPATWLTDHMKSRMPKADFGAAILELVPTVIADADRAGYNVRNTAVLTALDSVVVELASTGYATQLGSRQATYGTLQSGATGNAILDKRK